MADEAMQESTDSSAEQTAGESQSQEQTTQSDVGGIQSQDQSTEQSQASDTDSGKADSAGSSDKEQTQDQTQKTDSKPRSRRSASYRIQQLVNENNELKKQVGKPKQEQNDWDDEGASDEPKPDIAALVAQEVERRLNPVISEHSKSANDAEINELFSGDNAADKSKYEGRIREMWNLPQYKDVAAADLYKIAKYDELAGSIDSIKQQAIEEHKKAEKEAKESSASGNSSTSNRTGKGKSITDMSDAELLEHNERVKAGKA